VAASGQAGDTRELSDDAGDPTGGSGSAKPIHRLVATDFFGLHRPSRCTLRVWLRQHGVKESPRGPFADLLIAQGDEHEEAHLARYPDHLDLGSCEIAERVERTRDAISSCSGVVYQGALSARTTLAGINVEIVGVPDFLLPSGTSYLVRDSKVARRINDGRRPEITLQMQTYGWLYERTFGSPPVALQIHNGAGEIRDVPYDGGERALAELEEILSIRLAEEPPNEIVGWSKCSGCRYFERCWPAAVAQRSIGLLPRVDRGLIGELTARGVTTLDELLERFDSESLATLDRPRGSGRAPVGNRADRILLSARALVENRPIVLETPAFPEHPNYVMFDLEGLMPRLNEVEKIYLWGMQVFGEHPGEFRAATADFGDGGDREGWEAFLTEAEAIFAEHGDIPFVHWARYEKTKIDLYVNRYGDRDGVAERVRKNLLDLLPITYESVVVPLSNYGLKSIEELVGFERTLKGAGGEWSVARYLEATETEDRDLRAAIMDEILTYNREDLEATWAVMKWLQGLK